ncbi:glucosaminidase domain-containing protein [Labilibacter marinus]|uniref:glucosaminidase domain-containing protein n=1 Tax=Labilibacter marinus TaxID=1477105 RepID=UPI00095026F4|nr:glucosaminidase domain-containing protein [Labilibacter marinus]
MKIRVLISLAAIMLLYVQLAAQSKKRYTKTEYIQQYKDLAIKEMKRTGVPASITMAQAVLESRYGNSILAQRSNNHFGIKCHSDWKGKTITYSDDNPDDCFRVYKKVYNSYIDHSNFLLKNARYASLFELKVTDYKNWALGLKEANYATDPAYPYKLIRIIEEERLFLLDKKRWNKVTAPESAIDDFEIILFKTHEIKYNNGVKYIKVEDGDSFGSISEEFGLRAWELYTYNDLKEDANIKRYRYIYIQSKRSKAHRKHVYHVVKEGESLHYISQKYGIKEKNLLKYNHLKKGEPLQKGIKLNLRRKKK